MQKELFGKVTCSKSKQTRQFLNEAKIQGTFKIAIDQDQLKGPLLKFRPQIHRPQ